MHGKHSLYLIQCVIQFRYLVTQLNSILSALNMKIDALVLYHSFCIFWMFDQNVQDSNNLHRMQERAKTSLSNMAAGLLFKRFICFVE